MSWRCGLSLVRPAPAGSGLALLVELDPVESPESRIRGRRLANYGTNLSKSDRLVH